MDRIRLPLNGPVLCGLVWRYLGEHPCQRPRVGDLAQAFGLTERGLRRIHHRAGGPTLRAQLAYACLSYAACLISTGTKSEAAIRLAGFRSRWNFNRQCRQFGLGSAARCRLEQPGFQFGPEAVEDALRAYDRARQRLLDPHAPHGSGRRSGWT
jgi:AraC-like DNA-binding protein